MTTTTTADIASLIAGCRTDLDLLTDFESGSQPDIDCIAVYDSLRLGMYRLAGRLSTAWLAADHKDHGMATAAADIRYWLKIMATTCPLAKTLQPTAAAVGRAEASVADHNRLTASVAERIQA